MSKNKILIATYCDSTEELENVCRLTASLRSFGGKYSHLPISVHIPIESEIEKGTVSEKLESLGIETQVLQVPERAQEFFYGGKPYAASQAETVASLDHTDVLVWVDNDAIVLDEPRKLDLAEEIGLAYKPVMHNRVGSLFADPPGQFWAYVYKKMGITDNLLFPMFTPADGQKIRAYFHCGLLAVRPEHGILSRWAREFEILYQDPAVVNICKSKREQKIFLHQHALTGAVLHNLTRDGMKELPDSYNYPIFFDRQYTSTKAFNSIDDAIIIRCVVSLEKIGPDWHQQLKGPPDKIKWLREHL